MSGKSQTVEKQFPGQHEGEVVDFVFRQHPLVMRKALILGLLAIMFGVLPLDFPQIYASERWTGFFIKLALSVLVVVVLAWIYRWIGWYYTVYIVTNRRILAIRQKGFFDRKVDEWQLDGVQNVNYHMNGFQAALFGYGDITMRTYIGDLEMKTIHNPAEIHEQLMEAVRRGGGATASMSTQLKN